MFSDELEMLIDAAIADGEITEKERAVLYKRGKAEGVDPDELDLVISSRLKKHLSQTQEEEEKDDGPTAAQKLLKKIEELNDLHKDYRRQIRNDRPAIKKGASKLEMKLNVLEYKSDQWSNDSDRDKAIVNAIRNWEVPKSKREYTDMILLCKQSFNRRNEKTKEELENARHTHAYGPLWEHISPVSAKDLDKFDVAYIAKAQEICDKINSYYPNDAKLQKLVKGIERSDAEFEKLNSEIEAVKEEKRRENAEIKARKEAEEAKRMKNPFYRFFKKFK